MTTRGKQKRLLEAAEAVVPLLFWKERGDDVRFKCSGCSAFISDRQYNYYYGDWNPSPTSIEHRANCPVDALLKAIEDCQ